MNIKTNPINFKGQYIIQGNKTDTNQLYQIIRNENQIADIPTDCVRFSTGDILVLTKDDVEKKNSIIKIKDAYDISFSTIKTSRVLDKINNIINKRVTRIDTVYGDYDEIFEVEQDGIKFYPYKSNGNSHFEKEMKCKCTFDKPLELKDAINKIYQIDDKYYKHADNTKTYFIMKANVGAKGNLINTVMADPYLKGLKVKGLVGAGAFTMVFDIGNDKVLKISDYPCAPIKTETFDLPVLKKGIDRKNKIYWCVVPKAENETESRLTIYEIKNAISKIKKQGFMCALDLKEVTPWQFVKYKGQVYLSDYDCALKECHGDRMYK